MIDARENNGIPLTEDVAKAIEEANKEAGITPEAPKLEEKPATPVAPPTDTKAATTEKPAEKKAEEEKKAIPSWEHGRILREERAKLHAEHEAQNAEAAAALKEKEDKITELLNQLEGSKKGEDGRPLTPQAQEALEKRLERLEASRQAETAALQEEVEFDKEFRNNVEPMIRKEYPSVSAEGIESIRSKLSTLGYDTKYVNTPLDLLYKGLEDFRGMYKEPSRSAEATKSLGARDQTVDLENVTEEDLQRDPELAEKLVKYQRQKNNQ